MYVICMYSFHVQLLCCTPLCTFVAYYYKIIIMYNTPLGIAGTGFKRVGYKFTLHGSLN